jgi:hypothetical protein
MRNANAQRIIRKNTAMSQSEVERFTADLKSNAALRALAEKAQAYKSHATPLARATAFANSEGYKFSLDHAREAVKAKAKAAGKELTDAELDGVAGGATGLCVGSGGQPSFERGQH